MSDYLTAQLRIDLDDAGRLDSNRLSEVAAVYRNANVTRLAEFVKEMQA